MTHDILTPQMISYLPFLYTIWADGLLTDSELDVIRHVIQSDDLLTETDRGNLLRFLNPEEVPLDPVWQHWKQLFQNSNLLIDFEQDYPLTDYAVRLARSINPEFESNFQRLAQIETQLGLQPGQYSSLFQDLPIQPIVRPSFEPGVMRAILDGSYSKLVYDFQATITREGSFQWTYPGNIEEYRQKTAQRVIWLGKKGYGSMAYAGEYGGHGDLGAYGHIFENLIYTGGSTAVKFGVQYGLFGGSIANLGTEKHHKKWLEDLGAGRLLGCFAMTEENHGSNVRGLKTTATYIPGEEQLVIHTPEAKDCKIYIGGAMSAKMATVFAQLIVRGINHGVHAIVVPLRDDHGHLLPGIRIEDNGPKVGLNGVDNGRIWFDSVRVPVFNLLDRFGSIDSRGNYQSPIDKDNKRFFTMLGTLVAGRICVGKGSVAGSKLALAIAMRYAYQRRQFGKDVHSLENLLIEYPSHQMRLFPLLAKTYALHFALEDLMKRYAASTPGSDVRELEAEAAALKALASWHGNSTVQECREACGGQGYMSENRLGSLRADLDVFATFEGDNHVILQLAAKGVLSAFQSDFNADSLLGVIKYLSRNWADTLVTFNPVYTNNVDVSHLYSRDFHADAFSYRRRRLTFSLAQRMNRLFRKRVSPYQAFLRVQTHVTQVAIAYAEERCLMAMHATINTTQEPEEIFMLKKLSALFALATMYEHNGWYLEQGYFSGRKSKAIRQLIHRHVQQLVPDGLALVDAFGIPEQYLDLPLLKVGDNH